MIVSGVKRTRTSVHDGLYDPGQKFIYNKRNLLEPKGRLGILEYISKLSRYHDLI